MLFSDVFLFNIARAAVLAAVAVGLLGLTLRNFRRLSPTGHRRVWFGILLLGLCVFRIPIDIPFYKPEPVVLAPQVEAPLMMPIREELPLPEMRPVESSVLPIATPAETPPEPGWQFPETATLLLFGWAGGLAVLLLRRAFLALRLHRLLRRVEKADADDVRPWAELLNHYGIAGDRIPILWTDEAGPALVRSWFGDRLLFPRSLWDELSERQRLGVLRHELCHYLHGDAWADEIARLLAMLQWFNPAAWLALHKFAEATEWRCDDFSYNGREGRPEDLIETLLSVHDSTESLGLYLSSFARLNVLHRINRLLETPQPQESSIMKKTLLFVLPLVLFALGLLQINLVAQQSAPATTEPAQTEPTITEPEASARDQAQPSGSDRLGVFEAEENGETVWKIRGRVLYPDGQPAKKIEISFNFNSSALLSDTDENGYFTQWTRHWRPGKWHDEDFYMAGVSPNPSSDPESWPWAVPPMVLKNAKDQSPEKFIFRLQKACPISVEVQFERETTPGDVNILFLPNGDQDITLNNKIRVPKDKTGLYHCALLPGKYGLNWDQVPWLPPETTFTISEKDAAEGAPRKIVLNVSAPSIIDLGEENGKHDSLELQQSLTAEDRLFLHPSPIKERDPEGRFLVQLSPYCNFITCDGGEKAGFLNVTDAETAGKPYSWVMNRKATGKVRLINKPSGKPIADVKVEYAFPFDWDGGRQYGGIPTETTTDHDGFLELKMLPDVEYRILVYEPVQETSNEESRIFQAERTLTATKPGELNDFGDIGLDVSPDVKPFTDASGSGGNVEKKTIERTVLLPNGSPAKGVKVCLGTACLRISPPDLVVVATGPTPDQIVVAETDAQGKFRFTLPEAKKYELTPLDVKDYQLCFVHPDGYAQVNNKVLMEKETFTLRKYGSLEVRIPFDKKPGAFNIVDLGQPSTPENRENDPTFPQVDYQGKISEDGFVKFDKIAPGEYVLSTWGQNATKTWLYSAMDTSTEIMPGETTKLDLRTPISVAVTGKVRLPKEFDGEMTDDDWARSFIEFASDSRLPKKEQRGYVKTFELSKNNPRESSFKFDALAPGGWNRRITIYKYEPEYRILAYHLDFVTIPAPEKGAENSATVFDMGTIDLTLDKNFKTKKDADPPTVTVHGKVFLPDGSLAKNRWVTLNYTYLTQNAGSGGLTPVNEQGEYSVKLQVGTRMTVIAANREKGSEWLEDGLASPIVSAVVTENPTAGQYDLRLQKGIRVSGTMRYEDGTAAVGKSLLVHMYGFGGERFPLPEKNELGETCYYRPNCYQRVWTDKDGRYTLWLLPDQEYELEQEDSPGENRQQSLKLTADEKERTIDYTLPQPTAFRFVLPDGRATSEVVVDICSRMGEHDNRNIVRLEPESDGVFPAVLSPIANLVSAKTYDGKFGTNRLIQGDERLKPITIPLQPAAIGKVRFVDKGTGKPIVGRKLGYYPFRKINDNLLLMNSDRPEDVQTDENGIATLPHLYVGADYSLYDGYEIQPKMPSVDFTAQKPGETVDRGTVEVPLSPKPTEPEASARDQAQPLAHASGSVASGSERSGSESDSKKLVVVRGRVTDPDGKPVKGALLVWETTQGQQRENRDKAARTDKDGRYSSPPLPPMKGSITVISEGYAPDMKPVDFATEKEVDFSLEKGKTLQIRVVDQNGEPIPNVGVTIDAPPFQTWRVGANIFNGSAEYSYNPRSGIPFQTDKNGLYRWTWAPADAIGFSFDKTGYETIVSDLTKSDLMFTAREEPYTVVMRKAFTISGTVVDDETGKPIPRFRFYTGDIVGSHPFFGRIAWQKKHRDTSVMNNGKFEHVFTFLNDEGYVFSIEADGYEAFVSRDILPDEANPTFAVRLKKSDGVSGAVVLPDGSPAAGAIVYLAEPGAYLGVRNPPKDDYLRQSRSVTKTDNSGRLHSSTTRRRRTPCTSSTRKGSLGSIGMIS